MKKLFHELKMIKRRLLRQQRCKHTHIFKLNFPNEDWWKLQKNGQYKKMGKHGMLQIKGCYICGKIWAHDYGA